MNLINRTVGRALADARADERASQRETVITLRRLPGATLWTVLVNDVVTGSSGYAGALQGLMEEVRKAGGRAVVVYDDQDSIRARLDRRQAGREVASAVAPGHFLYVRWSKEDQAYAPCEADDAYSQRFDVQAVSTEAGKIVFRSGLCQTVPVDHHAVLKLAPLPTVES